MVAGQITIKIDRAVALVDVASIGSQRVYVQVTCGSHTDKTEEGKGENPLFPDSNNTFNWPGDDDWEINCLVMARRKVKSDKQLGIVNINVQEAALRCQHGPILLPLTEGDGGHVQGELRVHVAFTPQEAAQGQLAAKGLLKLCSYRIDVKTSDVLGAGTDSRVKIRFTGTYGDSGEHELKSARNDFERDKLDTFFIQAADVGPQLLTCEVTCGLSGTRVGDAWHLRDVTITNTNTNMRARFPCNSWFDKKNGWTHMLTAGLTEQASQRSARRSSASGTPEVAAVTATAAIKTATTASQEAGKLCYYRVDVKTSDLFGCATDSSVAMVLHGASGDTGELELRSIGKNFERNKLDTFFLQAADVGAEFTACQLLCGGSGVRVGAAWHCDYASVTNTDTGVQARFTFNRWFNENLGWKHTVKPDAPVYNQQPELQPVQSYRQQEEQEQHTSQWYQPAVQETGADMQYEQPAEEPSEPITQWQQIAQQQQKQYAESYAAQLQQQQQQSAAPAAGPSYQQPTNLGWGGFK